MIHPYLRGLVAMQEPLKPFDGTEPYKLRRLSKSYHGEHGNDSRNRTN